MTNDLPRVGGRAAGLRAMTSCAVAALCTLGSAFPADAAAPAASPAHRIALPRPTGPYRVGEVELHLVDHSRADPWQSGQKHRELMASVYYPAGHTSGRPAAPYMLPAAAEHFDHVTADDYLGLNVPAGRADWAGTATRTARGADVDTRRGRLPVVLYSPGLGEPRTWGTTLVADLAGHGYVVVTVDNTYESPEVQFPNGSLATMLPPGDPDSFVRKSLAVRVTDTRFVLDQLQLLNSGGNPDADGQRLPEGLAGALDLSRVGMFGHSMGGTAAALSMDADHRIAAGIDMDGNLTNIDGSLMPVAQHGLDRPFLLLGKDGETDTGPGWQAFRTHTPGWTRQLTLRGSEHASFTDAEALLPQLHLSPSVQTADLGTLDPATAIHTNEAYDRVLRPLAARPQRGAAGQTVGEVSGDGLRGLTPRRPAPRRCAGAGRGRAVVPPAHHRPAPAAGRPALHKLRHGIR